MDLGLKDKAALVSGSSRGIGRAIAMALAGEGCRVALSSRGGPDLDRAVADANALAPGSVGVAGDVTSEAGAATVAASAIDRLGGVDILINNVGGSAARTFDSCDDADLAAILDRNLWPAFRLSRALLPQMKSRGGGVIIMITSIWGRESGGGPSYNVAKAAEMALAKAMARDLAKDQVRVASVAPGSIFFPGGGWEKRQKADPDGIADFIKRDLPFGRFGTPEEVANVVAFLASPRASWAHGSCWVVDGGQSHAF